MIAENGAGTVVTFYSFKGGTGRTMALANMGCLLATRARTLGAKPVLVVDWDLEAPGLHRYFREYVRDAAVSRAHDRFLNEQPGLLEYLEALIGEAEARGLGPTASGAEIDALFASVDLRPFVVETDIPGLFLLKAAAFDDEYASRVRTWDWAGIYGRYPWFFKNLALSLSRAYSHTLIDSRTGITDTRGICTMLMPSKLVVVFTPNRQSLTGVVDLVSRAVEYRRESDDLRPMLVFPLPSRTEPSEPLQLRHWRRGYAAREIVGFQPEFERLFAEVYGLQGCSLDRYFDEVEVQQHPFYAYGEKLAVQMEQDMGRLTLSRSYVSFCEWLIRDQGPWVPPSAPSPHEIYEVSRRFDETQRRERAATRQRTYSMGAAIAIAVVMLIWSELRSDAVVSTLTIAQDSLREREDSLASLTATTLLTRASEHYGAGVMDSALASVNLALQLDSANEDGLSLRGDIHFFMQNYPEAIADYSALLARDSADYGAYQRRAAARLLVGDTGRAVADLRRVVRFTRSDSVVRATNELISSLRPEPASDTTSAPAEPRVPPSQRVIYIRYRDPADSAVARRLARDLGTRHGRVTNIRNVSHFVTRWTVRYFHPTDRARADSVRQVVQRSLVTQEVEQPVELLPLTGEYSTAARGQLEVWLAPTRGTEPVDTTVVPIVPEDPLRRPASRP